ncbi:MAG TPA: hypothetical protein VN833_17140 [Candidatus Acidoferrales bacterium]|jgi:hypothetical protein|nr:hypothetical protein [Candidatus Acidoferrales bacterium]
MVKFPNYLYLSHKLAEIDDPVKRDEFLKAVAHGSAAAWEHVNLLGEYDLSEEKFKDSVGIKPPKLTDQPGGRRGSYRIDRKPWPTGN